MIYTSCGKLTSKEMILEVIQLSKHETFYDSNFNILKEINIYEYTQS